MSARSSAQKSVSLKSSTNCFASCGHALDSKRSAYAALRQCFRNSIVCSSLAEVAHTWGYERPELVNEGECIVRQGRHAVIEQLADQLPTGKFIPE